MTTKYGMFKEHNYLKPGAPIPAGTGTGEGGEPAVPQDREGLNLKTTVGKKGKGNDATFGKFISLYQGDKYVDPLKARLQSEAEKRKHNITEAPFKTAHELPKSSTPGDFYGTSGKVPYVTVGGDEKKKKGEIPEKPKGIYTSPAKKGTFGMNKFTLSERAGFKGIATEYEYQHDPESLQLARKRAEHEADRKARVTDLPFKPAAPPKKGGFGVPNTTISKGKGVAGEWEYVIVPTKEDEGAKRKAGADTAPFKPVNAFASQRMEHIPYIHDPEVPKLKAESEKRLAESARVAATGAWKPTQGYKTDMVRSIVRMNLR